MEATHTDHCLRDKEVSFVFHVYAGAEYVMQALVCGRSNAGMRHFDEKTGTFTGTPLSSETGS